MTAPAVAEAQDVCASDPNFAVIFAFCERFGDSCGVTIPTFQELQEMLENTDQVPDALVDLHIKLLRRVKRSVHVDKWERAILKFCQGYSIPEIWELERYGYKGISIQLKLKILKTLFEAQFDSNPKFKAEINKLESSSLRSQPLGWDKLGIAYWLQFDRACNLRVYREDTDEDTWKIVAKDRSTLVNLINELSGTEDNTLDDIDDSNSIETGSDAEVELSPGLDQEVNSPTSPNSTPVNEDIKKECKIIDSANSESEKNPVNFKKEFNENDTMHNNINVPIVGETIEESVMIVKGEGSGKECDTGNPDEPNTQNEASKNEDVKKPKLWSIETICSSSKEVREDVISVPTTGFFFGDDSVPCFNNVSNGENSHIKEDKLIVNPLKENDEELKNKNKTDEIDSNTLSHSDESLNKECSFENEDDLSSINVSKQSVFNIKVHEEEVQITERKANEVFTKSNSNTKEETLQTNVYTSTVNTHCKLEESQVYDTNDDNQSHSSEITDKCDDTVHTVTSNMYENKIIDKHKIISDSEEAECKNIEDSQQIEHTTSYTNVNIPTIEQENLSLKSDGSSKEEIEKHSKNDQPHIKITDPKTDEHIFDTKIEFDKQYINDKVEKVSTSYENITKESTTNTEKKCLDINNQNSIYMIEQKTCELDKKNLSNAVTENEILVNESSIIESKEEAMHFISDNNKIDKQISKNIIKPLQTTDDSVANYELSYHTPNEFSTINTINLKAHDQTKTDTVNPCIKTSKLIDDDQINKKPINTSHNISNIINTETTVVINSVEGKEQSTNIDANKNKQLNICQIISKNNLEKNIILEEKIVMNVDSPIVSYNKHSLDNILKKSDKIKDIIEFPNLEKTTKQIDPTDKPVPSSLKIDLPKIVKPEKNIEKLETKCMDIPDDQTVIKKECNLTENNISIDLVIPSVHKKEIIETKDKIQNVKEKKIVEMINKIPSVQEKEIIETKEKIQNVKEKKVVETIVKFPSVQKKITVETVDKISSIQEEKIVETIYKIPSVQEKEIVKTIDQISCIQEEKIVETINKIPSVQEKEVVNTIDQISSIQEEKIVETINKIPRVQEEEIVDTVDIIPSVQEKEIVGTVDNTPRLQEKKIVATIDEISSKQEEVLVETNNKIPNIQKKEIVDTDDKTSKVVKNDDKHTVISIEQCSKDDNLAENDIETNPKIEEIKQNEKSNLTNVENKNDSFHKEKSNLEEEEEVEDFSDNDDNLVHDKSETMEVSKEIDEKNADEAFHNDKLLKDKQTSKNEVKKEVNTDEDIKIQSLKIKKDKKDNLGHVQDLHEKNILKHSEEQEITSPVHEDMYESNDETNEDTFIESFSKDLDDSKMMDQTIEEDDKKSDEENEEVPKKRGRPGRKKGKRGRTKKINAIKQETKSNSEEKVKRTYKPRQKKVVTIAEEVTVFPEPAGEENIRRSRRIAEIKIKEQFVPVTHYDDIDIPLKVSKKKDKGGKKGSTPTKKNENFDISDDEDEEDPISKKFKKKKRKGKSDSLKKLNVRNPWNVDSESSSSENNIGLFEDYDHEEEDEIPRPGIEPNVSDHEFSPESDINDDDEDFLPEKRARTAHKKDEDEQIKDDMPCQKCNKSDQPEWILLCDTCNQGWHASCLRPALMVIPDGDWYCPHCRHEALLVALKETLKKYDGESKKRENEELRRKRLAYVGISLQNVIASKTEEVKTVKPELEVESSEDEESESESGSYDSEPLYQLRARRQAHVSYRFNDYDEMINDAILEETGVDESAGVKSIDSKKSRNEDDKTDSGNDENNRDREDSPIAPALLHLRGRKKSKKLTNLDISSDDGSDEDFKGPSDGDDDYEEDLSEYSDDSIRRQSQPTRRSVRNRKTVVDPDFINDDSSEDSDQRSKKKRSRPWSESSNSEEEDFTWGKKKKKRTNAPSSSSLSFKQHKGSKRKRSENDKSRKQKKSKIKYGIDMDSDSDGQPKRRTRGRQITYAESDDSEEEVQTKKRKVASDEEDEYVLNEEELEAENEDQNLEVDEDALASNDEKDEELDEEDVVEEEEDDEEEEVEEEDEPKLAAVAAPINPQIAVKSSLKNVQSVIRGPPTAISVSSTPSSVATDFVQDPQQNIHQRLLPPVIGATPAQTNQQSLPPLSVVDSTVDGTLDKRKRPSQQLKKSLSPNSSVDYGGNSSYPFPPDATKVVLSSLPLPPTVHVPYNRPPATTGGFKPMAAVQPPPGGFPVTVAPYRMANKISTGAVSAPPAYLPPQQPSQVQQVYQTPPLPANYSPYPIDYANAGTPLPPPPPTIAFRNVVTAPTSHEPLSSAPSTQQSATAGGDSEFGGLVSYFSSQQEDDFDT